MFGFYRHPVGIARLRYQLPRLQNRVSTTLTHHHQQQAGAAQQDSAKVFQFLSWQARYGHVVSLQ
jgi:hypothetical protein